LVELDEANALACNGRDVVRPDLGAQGEQARRDGAADAAAADDADAELRERSDGSGRARIPAAAADVAVEDDDASDEREQERERVIRHLLRAVVGHADDGDPTSSGGSDVDVI